MCLSQAPELPAFSSPENQDRTRVCVCNKSRLVYSQVDSWLAVLVYLSDIRNSRRTSGVVGFFFPPPQNSCILTDGGVSSSVLRVCCVVDVIEAFFIFCVWIHVI